MHASERDGKLIPFERFYVPEAAFDIPHQATYRAWASQGQLIATPGNIIDFDRIEADILEATTRFKVGEIAYDPWQATQLANPAANARRARRRVPSDCRELLRADQTARRAHVGLCTTATLFWPG
jgi:phage terminase large subunit-like protein